VLSAPVGSLSDLTGVHIVPATLSRPAVLVLRTPDSCQTTSTFRSPFPPVRLRAKKRNDGYVRSTHIGELTAWHDPTLKFDFTAAHVAELAALKPPARLTRPLRYYALIAKGDELLDWREMLARYAGCDGEVLEGSDHGLTDFEAHLPGLLRHLRA